MGANDGCEGYFYPLALTLLYNTLYTHTLRGGQGFACGLYVVVELQ